MSPTIPEILANVVLRISYLWWIARVWSGTCRRLDMIQNMNREETVCYKWAALFIYSSAILLLLHSPQQILQYSTTQPFLFLINLHLRNKAIIKMKFTIAFASLLALAAAAPTPSEQSTDACLLKRGDGSYVVERSGCGYYTRSEASTDACLLKREADGKYTIEERGGGCGFYTRSEASTDACLLKRDDGSYVFKRSGCGYYTRSEASSDACLLKREADGTYAIEERGGGCGFYTRSESSIDA